MSASRKSEPASAAQRRRLAYRIEPEHPHRARLRGAETLADLDRRRLAGPVGAQQREDRPALDRHRDPVDRASPAVHLDEVADLDGRRTGGIHLASLGIPAIYGPVSLS